MGIAKRADRFGSPVGTIEERATGKIYPGLWYSSNPYLNHYLLAGRSWAFHTGDDLNLPKNADAHNAVYAVANGTVIFAARVPSSTWGNVIVIEHIMPDDKAVYSRYGHVEDMAVKKGDIVEIGQQIASVGDAFNQFEYHLHFDIGISRAMKITPWHWPGNTKQGVIDNYANPRKLIQEHQVIDSEDETEDEPEEVIPVSDVRKTTVNVNMRWIPNTSGKILRLLLAGTQVRLAGAMRNNNGYNWQLITVDGNDQCGWAVENYLGPMTPTRSKLGLNFIGPGAFPEATAMIDRLAKAGKPLALAVVINEPGLVATIKVLSPTTKVVYRHTAMPAGPTITGDIVKDRAAGRAFFNQYWPLLAAGAGADYFQFCNEWLSYDNAAILAGGVAAYDGLMDEAQSKGVKITVGDLNVGHPAPAIAYLLNPMLLRAAQLGHPLNYHSYTRPGTTDPSVEGPGRCMRWVDYLKSGLKVIIGEYGPDDGNAAFPGAEKCVLMCKQFDELLKPYASQVLGYGYWAESAGHSWPQSDVTPALQSIEMWLKSV